MCVCVCGCGLDGSRSVHRIPCFNSFNHIGQPEDDVCQKAVFFFLHVEAGDEYQRFPHAGVYRVPLSWECCEGQGGHDGSRSCWPHLSQSFELQFAPTCLSLRHTVIEERRPTRTSPKTLVIECIDS